MNRIKLLVFLIVLTEGLSLPSAGKEDNTVVIDIMRKSKEPEEKKPSKADEKEPEQRKPEDQENKSEDQQKTGKQDQPIYEKILQGIKQIQDQLDTQHELQQSVLSRSGLLKQLLSPQGQLRAHPAAEGEQEQDQIKAPAESPIEPEVKPAQPSTKPSSPQASSGKLAGPQIPSSQGPKGQAQSPKSPRPQQQPLQQQQVQQQYYYYPAQTAYQAAPRYDCSNPLLAKMALMKSLFYPYC